MRAIVWLGTEGVVERDDDIRLRDPTEALVWVSGMGSDDDLTGVVLSVGDDVCSFEPGEKVVVRGSSRRGSSLWGLTEYAVAAPTQPHAVRVPLAELNLVDCSPTWKSR